MKKYFFLIPIVMVNYAITSCRSSDEIETITPTEISSSPKTQILYSIENDSLSLEMLDAQEGEKKPPLKDKQDWKTGN